MTEVKCQFCGNEYLPDRSTQRFCSKVCSDRWWAAERCRGIEALRSQTYFGMTLLEAAENQGRYAQVGAIGGPLPAPNWSRDPTGPEPPIEGNPLAYGEDVSGRGR